jgi:hypothetical protein
LAISLAMALAPGLLFVIVVLSTYAGRGCDFPYPMATLFLHTMGAVHPSLAFPQRPAGRQRALRPPSPANGLAYRPPRLPATGRAWAADQKGPSTLCGENQGLRFSQGRH